MENSTKTLIFAFFFSFFSPIAAQYKTSLPAKILPACSNKQFIGNKLYTDSTKALYLKVKNRPLLHPSVDPKKMLDSIFLEQAYDETDSTTHTLNSIVHPATFKQLDPNGFYFSDTNRIYIYMVTPHPVQFFSIPNVHVTFIDKGKQYLLNDKKLYCQGLLVENINIKTLSVLTFSDTTNNDLYEFVTDGKILLNSGHPLDAENLEFFDISNRDKQSILSRFFSQ